MDISTSGTGNKSSEYKFKIFSGFDSHPFLEINPGGNDYFRLKNFHFHTFWYLVRELKKKKTQKFELLGYLYLRKLSKSYLSQNMPSIHNDAALYNHWPDQVKNTHLLVTSAEQNIHHYF